MGLLIACIVFSFTVGYTIFSFLSYGPFVGLVTSPFAGVSLWFLIHSLPLAELDVIMDVAPMQPPGLDDDDGEDKRSIN